MPSVYFFATASDLLPALLRLEKVRDVKYFSAGIFRDPAPDAYSSGAELPGLGLSTADVSGFGNRYLILENGAMPIPREIARKDGAWYAIDQLLNPDSMILSAGGKYGVNILIRGEFGTTGLTSASKSLLNAARRAVAKDFKRVRGTWVGAEAHQLLEAGWRLTASAAGSPNCDLQLED